MVQNNSFSNEIIQNLYEKLKSFFIFIYQKTNEKIKYYLSLISQGVYEKKYFEVFPKEYDKEVKLARERLKLHDLFYPSYEGYLRILKKARNDDRIAIIIWERYFWFSQWTIYIKGN